MAKKKINIKRADGIVQGYHVGSESDGIKTVPVPDNAVNPYGVESGSQDSVEDLYSKFSAKQKNDNGLTVEKDSDGSYYVGDNEVENLYGLIDKNDEGTYDAYITSDFGNGDADIIVLKSFDTPEEGVDFLKREAGQRIAEVKDFKRNWAANSAGMEATWKERIKEHKEGYGWDGYKEYAQEGIGRTLMVASGSARSATVFHHDDDTFLVEVKSTLVNNSPIFHHMSFETYKEAKGFAMENALAWDFEGIWSE